MRKVFGPMDGHDKLEGTKQMIGTEKKKDRVARFFILFAVSAVLFWGCVLLGAMRYDVNDDETFNLVLAGAYGPFVNIVYMNIIIARILSWLFQAFPSFNWYLAGMLAVNFTALFLLALVLTDKMETAPAVLVTAALYLVAGRDLFTVLQYTKNAALYTAVGTVLLIRAMEGKRYAKASLVGGTLLFSLGYMLRPESFAAALAFALVRLVLFAAEYRAVFLRRLRFLIAPAAFLILVFAVNRAAAVSDPEWAEYLRFHEARVALLDHGMPDYELHREEINALGFDELDLAMFRQYLYDDSRKFNADALEKLVEIRDRDGKSSLRINRTTVGLAFNRLVSAASSQLPAAAFCVLFIIAILFFHGPRAYFALVMAAGVAGEYWYLACTNRFAWRAEFGLWSVPLVLLAVAFAESRRTVMPGEAGEDITGREVLPAEETEDGKPRKDLRKQLPVLIAGLALIALQLGSGMYTFYFDKDAQFDYREPDMKAFLQAADGDREHVYMIDTFTIANHWILSPVSSITGECSDMYERVGFLGGWAGTSPYGAHFMRERGYESNLKALLEDEVYLADNSGTEEMIREYLDKEYGPGVSLTKAGKAGGVKIWKYTKEPAGDAGQGPDPASVNE